MDLLILFSCGLFVVVLLAMLRNPNRSFPWCSIITDILEAFVSSDSDHCHHDSDDSDA